MQPCSQVVAGGKTSGREGREGRETGGGGRKGGIRLRRFYASERILC